jgi:hypothetical protein
MTERERCHMARKHSNLGWSGGKQLIRSFGENRVCAAPACTTRLSRYNPEDWCYVHRDQIPDRRFSRGGQV